MTMDAAIREALLPLGLPVENGVYRGKEKQYFVFNYSTRGDNFGDDVPEEDRYSVQVHLYAPLNADITKRKKDVKKALLQAGFTWPETIDASDAEWRHIVFECENSEEVDLDGEI